MLLKKYKQKPQKPQRLKAEQVFTSVDIVEISNIIEPNFISEPYNPTKKYLNGMSNCGVLFTLSFDDFYVFYLFFVIDGRVWNRRSIRVCGLPYIIALRMRRISLFLFHSFA